MCGVPSGVRPDVLRVLHACMLVPMPRLARVRGATARALRGGGEEAVSEEGVTWG